MAFKVSNLHYHKPQLWHCVHNHLPIAHQYHLFPGSYQTPITSVSTCSIERRYIYTTATIIQFKHMKCKYQCHVCDPIQEQEQVHE